MREVTFTRNFDYPLNETQHAAYLEGQTLRVKNAVAEAAISAGAATADGDATDDADGG